MLNALRWVFDYSEWEKAGGDIGDNHQFWHPAIILRIRKTDYGESVADVKFLHNQKISYGHFLNTMHLQAP